MSPARFPMTLLAAALAAGATGGDGPSPQPGLISSNFIFENAPFPSAHASTIVETRSGLVAAWFGGSDEGNPDVGIWLSRDDGKGWTPPVEVARWNEGGKRLPCWNPVLFQPKGGPLWLFYKAGPTPANWWGMLISSSDDGKTWSNPRRLPDGFLGPVKNKPITLKDGSILAPTSFEDRGWRIHFERTTDLGQTWQTVGPVDDDKTWEAIQPTLLTHPDGRIQALCRSQQSKVVECWSADGGKTWSKLVATALPNPDSGHRRRHPRRRPPSARLQSHHQGPQSAHRRHLARWQDLEDRTGARRPARRILLPRRDPVGRRTGAHHLHLAPQEDPSCGGRPEETGVSGDVMTESVVGPTVVLPAATCGLRPRSEDGAQFR